MIHDIDQNTEAWDKIRADKLTASELGDWFIAQPKLTLNSTEIKEILTELEIEHKKSAKVAELIALLPQDVIDSHQGYAKKDQTARFNAMCRILGCSIAPVTKEFMGNKSTDFGHAYEDEAASAFELITGLRAVKVGFVTLDGFDYFGASPDRLVYSADKKHFMGVLEIKCKPEQHVKTVIEDVLPYENRLQLHFQMAITGANKGYFFSYSPDMKPMLKIVHADYLTDRVERGMVSFDAEYRAFREKHLSKLEIKEEGVA